MEFVGSPQYPVVVTWKWKNVERVEKKEKADCITGNSRDNREPQGPEKTRTLLLIEDN